MTTFPVCGAALSSATLPGRVWRQRTALVLAVVSPLAGCYTTRPVTTAPEPGTTVLLDLNDLARVQLGDRLGPSVSRIEGMIQSKSDTSYVLQISSVQYLNGQANKWSNEPFTVPASLVSSAQIRAFSRSRTTAVGVGIVAALAAVFAKTNFFGLGGGSKDPIPTPGGQT
jgi:hypothetical protein